MIRRQFLRRMAAGALACAMLDLKVFVPELGAGTATAASAGLDDISSLMHELFSEQITKNVMSQSVMSIMADYQAERPVQGNPFRFSVDLRYGDTP